MKIKRFQQGGQAPEQAPAGAPVQGQPQGGPGPEEQLAQMAQQIIQQMGPEGAAMLAQIIMQMLEGAAQQQPQGAPVMQRQGGRLVKVSRK